MKRLNYDEKGFAEQLMRDVEVTAENLNDCFMKQAGLYVYYAMQIKAVSKELGIKRIYMDTHSAKLGKEFRKEFIAAGTKPTEKMIENQVFITASYVKINLDIVELKTTETLLRDCLESLRHKKDMMVQVAMSQREEMKGTARMYEQPKPRFVAGRENKITDFDDN